MRTNCRDFASDQLPKPGLGSNLFIESLFIYLLYLSTFVGQMEEVGIDIVPSVNLYREKKEEKEEMEEEEERRLLSSKILSSNQVDKTNAHGLIKELKIVGNGLLYRVTQRRGQCKPWKRRYQDWL